jgi:L-ascorbate metabolism protein UlaG (beta-lactamase superfamily)
MDGTRVYFAGDTDFIPEMKDIAVDIALLPVSGTYVMTPEEAVQAALAIHPRSPCPCTTRPSWEATPTPLSSKVS